jgi:serine/threonine protein phosphatase PrpC
MANNSAYLILFIFALKCDDLVFRRSAPEKLKSNLAYPKDKLPQDDPANFFGEDASSMTAVGMTVCDGVGGYPFSSYFAAKLITLAAERYHLDLEEKEKISHKSTEMKDVFKDELSFQEEYKNDLESYIVRYLYAYQTNLVSFLQKTNFLKKDLKDNSNLETMISHLTFMKNNQYKFPTPSWTIHDYWMSEDENKELVKKFVKDTSKKLLLASDVTELPVSFQDVEIKRIFNIASTAISVTLAKDDNKKGNKMFIYQSGDSLVLLMRFAQTPNGFVQLEPLYISEDSSDQFNTPEAINLYDLKVSKTKKDKTQSSFISKKEAKTASITTRKDDVWILASDGLFDNLPLYVITRLVNGAVDILVRHKQGEEFDLDTKLEEKIVEVLVEFVKATSDIGYKDERIKKLLKLKNFYPKKDIIEIPVEESIEYEMISEDISSLSDCSFEEVFEIRLSDKNNQSQNILGACANSLLETRVNINTRDISEASMAFDNAIVSNFLAIASKIFMLINPFLIFNNKVIENENKFKSKMEEEPSFETNQDHFQQNIQFTGEKLSSNKQAGQGYQDNLFSNAPMSHHIEHSLSSDKEEDMHHVEALNSQPVELANDQAFAIFRKSVIQLARNPNFDTSLLQLADRVASESSFITPNNYQIDSINAARIKHLWPTFEVHNFVFHKMKGETVDLFLQAKEDDVVVLASIVDARTKIYGSKKQDRDRMNSETAEFFSNLMSSADMWLLREVYKNVPLI